MYGSTTKGDVVKRSDCILVYGSTTKGDVVKSSDCILVYGTTTKGDVVKSSDCILVYGTTTKSDISMSKYISLTPIHFHHYTHCIVIFRLSVLSGVRCVNSSTNRTSS